MTSTALSSAPTAGAVGARSPWFRSAGFDLPLILLTPLLVWPLVKGAEAAVGAALLTQLIWLTATGHYFATFVRTYGDRELFARFRWRLVLVPALFAATCLGMFATGTQAALLVVTTAWALWHWLAQAFGFARIYDIKVGSYRPLTALLDKLLVVGGFVGTIVLNAPSTAIFAKVWLDAGLPMPGAAAWANVQAATIVALAAIAIAYVGNLGWTIGNRQAWSWQKQVMHVMTIGFYWFAFSHAPNVLVAYVLYELFHDVQYFAITWLMCGQRARRPGVAPWFARLFRPGLGAAVLFVGAMLTFGGVDALSRTSLAPDSRAHALWLATILTFALMHYYFDGFVWKARERSVGADLGIRQGRDEAQVGAGRHAVRLAGFFVPIAVVAAIGQGPLPELARAEAMVAVAPGDFLSHNELGFALVKQQQPERALEQYAASVAAKGDFAPARVNYGSALDILGRSGEAQVQFEAALLAPDRDGCHRQARLALAALRLLAGDRPGADALLQAAGADPREARDRLLALAAASPDDARREALYRAALRLDSFDPEANYNLGLQLGRRQQFADAATHLLRVVEAAPQFVPGLLAAANVLARQGRTDEARGLVQRSLAAEPGNREAQQLQAQLR